MTIAAIKILVLLLIGLYVYYCNRPEVIPSKDVRICEEKSGWKNDKRESNINSPAYNVLLIGLNDYFVHHKKYPRSLDSLRIPKIGDSIPWNPNWISSYETNDSATTFKVDGYDKGKLEEFVQKYNHPIANSEEVKKAYFECLKKWKEEKG
jgi:hypothetical protein